MESAVAEVSVLPPAPGVEVDGGQGSVDAQRLSGGHLADEVGAEQRSGGGVGGE